MRSVRACVCVCVYVRVCMTLFRCFGDAVARVLYIDQSWFPSFHRGTGIVIVCRCCVSFSRSSNASTLIAVVRHFEFIACIILRWIRSTRTPPCSWSVVRDQSFLSEYNAFFVAMCNVSSVIFFVFCVLSERFSFNFQQHRQIYRVILYSSASIEYTQFH